MYSRGVVVERGIGQPPNGLRRASDQLCNELGFLIANPRLEFGLTYSKLSPLKIPNRERIAIFVGRFSELRICLAPSRSSLATVSVIDTPRLKITGSARKQRLADSPNRDKTSLFASPRRKARFSFAFQSSLSWLTPCLRGQTLTLREPQSNLAASCFVRDSADEHS